MEKVCPICNALQSINSHCPNCGHEMLDGGALENYFGPYSPYMDRDMLNAPFELFDDHCVHLLYCPNCHYDVRVAWRLVDI